MISSEVHSNNQKTTSAEQMATQLQDYEKTTSVEVMESQLQDNKKTTSVVIESQLQNNDKIIKEAIKNIELKKKKIQGSYYYFGNNKLFSIQDDQSCGKEVGIFLEDKKKFKFHK